MMEQVVKAGAFVVYQGRFIFVVGPDRHYPRHGVVRLGGHREPGESPLACAIREVQEEALLAIWPSQPPATYWAAPEGEPEAGPWPGAGTAADEGGEVPPLLVTYHPESGSRPRQTAIYLAFVDQPPVPAMETRGLLLLTPAQVQLLAHTPMTLAQCLAAGTKGSFRTPLQMGWPLRPSHHVRTLARLLELHPELV